MDEQSDAAMSISSRWMWGTDSNYDVDPAADQAERTRSGDKRTDYGYE